MTPETKPRSRRRLQLLRRILSPLIVLAALIVSLESWLWDHFMALARWAERAPPVRWTIDGYRRLPPLAMAFVVCLALAIGEPLKLIGLWLASTGHPVQAGIAIGSGYVLGTALPAWLVAQGRERLMTLAWFAWGYTRLHGLVRAAHDYLARQPAWVATRIWVGRMVRRLRLWSRR
ncbi:MAG: hypothetical protein J0H82_14345 [Alphaproteobacteria bacterium]|jgi:cytochrome c biogenesis protein CcdA|nr:hypothetical protein [Alphaproteobacteria bacterium]